MSEGENVRVLSDDDVVKIVEQLEIRFMAKFYEDLGRGLWGFVWKGLIGLILYIAAYGAWLKWGK